MNGDILIELVTINH